MALEALTKLEQEILADSQKIGPKKIEEAKKFAAEFIKKARMEAQREVEEINAKTQDEIRTLEKKKLSEARRNTQLQVLKEKNDLIARVFHDALNRIKDLQGKEVYHTSLQRLIEKSAQQLGSHELRTEFNENDWKHHTTLLHGLKLGPHVKITAEKLNTPSVGGFIISTADGKIKIDNTVEVRLNFMEKNLRREVAKILFE